jgi:hypothetical protein
LTLAEIPDTFRTMKVTYNSKKSETTITLSYVETRQFLSGGFAVKVVQDAVDELVNNKYGQNLTYIKDDSALTKK